MTFHNTKCLQIVSFHVIMRVSNLEGKKKKTVQILQFNIQTKKCRTPQSNPNSQN